MLQILLVNYASAYCSKFSYFLNKGNIKSLRHFEVEE
jgi:hypothetical protein